MQKNLKIVFLIFLILAGGLIANASYTLYKWNKYKSELIGEAFSLDVWPLILFGVLAMITTLSLVYLFFNLKRFYPKFTPYLFLIFFLATGLYLFYDGYRFVAQVGAGKSYTFFVFWLLMSMILNGVLLFSTRRRVK